VARAAVVPATLSVFLTRFFPLSSSTCVWQHGPQGLSPSRHRLTWRFLLPHPAHDGGKDKKRQQRERLLLTPVAAGLCM
jgi:hypothetical protein